MGRFGGRITTKGALNEEEIMIVADDKVNK